MNYTVKQLSKLAGVTVRTLHYYDQIGLLKPEVITENGYRQYGDQQLVRLQQILFFKELEFSLADIVKILNSPQYNQREALQDQFRLLELRKHRLEILLRSE